ncbi:Fe-S-cluster oxidoreductase [Imperialibacter sp. EC-SDR9]|nr:Fe-S-cluster oxidoreductase [Imperialibacter sp. 75]CAD5261513.1 Fe-S-cluster oxidoreductase [Imperialibacter sp. 89]VVT24705.1 Fe-S-cluster oxidoreductase [Imperialibacter sp. EC-SDR9]
MIQCVALRPYSYYLSIYKKVAAVERVFDGLQKEISTFQAQSSLKCLTGCGKCCTKSDLSATILEFLPLAYHLYKTDKAEEMLAKMDEESESTICHLFNPLVVGAGSGFCGNYKYRGLICRLFGYAASRDKNGQKTLVTCQLIKADQPVQYQTTVGAISAGTMAVPMMSDYQSQLMGIDWELGSKFYPVNTAIRKAVEMVLFYYQFRGRRAS